MGRINSSSPQSHQGRGKPTEEFPARNRKGSFGRERHCRLEGKHDSKGVVSSSNGKSSRGRIIKKVAKQKWKRQHQRRQEYQILEHQRQEQHQRRGQQKCAVVAVEGDEQGIKGQTGSSMLLGKPRLVYF